MPIQRMATDVFKDGGLGPTGQAVYDHIKNISGKDSNIIQLKPGDEMYNSGGGFVPWANPQDVYVDPGKGGAHVLAHELGHSQFKTDLEQKYENNMLQYSSPFSPDDIRSNGLVPWKNNKGEDVNPVIEGDDIVYLDPTKGSAIRYAYEKAIAPTMLEEANAQGVAVGTTEALGLGNQETMYDKPTDYPETFGRKGVEELNYNFSPQFEGAPLGIGITGSPSAREEYYRIQDNIPQRVERAYLRGKSLVQ